MSWETVSETPGGGKTSTQEQQEDTATRREAEREQKRVLAPEQQLKQRPRAVKLHRAAAAKSILHIKLIPLPPIHVLVLIPRLYLPQNAL